eukprot:gene27350-33035_t
MEEEEAVVLQYRNCFKSRKLRGASLLTTPYNWGIFCACDYYRQQPYSFRQPVVPQGSFSEDLTLDRFLDNIRTESGTKPLKTRRRLVDIRECLLFKSSKKSVGKRGSGGTQKFTFEGEGKRLSQRTPVTTTVTKKEEEKSSAAGIGTLHPSSHAHQPPPLLCTVKVNCGATRPCSRRDCCILAGPVRIRRPSMSSAASTSLGTTTSATCVSMAGQPSFNQYARGCLDDNKAFLDGLMATEPCWWMHHSSTAASSSELSGRLSFTVTVMRSGIPLDVARSAQELGCSDVMEYPRDRSLKWLRDFVHGAGVLHCDCRSPNLMAFLYSKKVVKRLSEQFGQLPCLQGLREYKGMFVDVQVIDFDLSLVCKDEGDAKSNKSIPVVEGAQKTNMVRVIAQFAKSSEDFFMNRSELPWNAEYDLQMLWTTLSDMRKDTRRHTISWGQYLLSRFGIKSLSQQVDLDSNDRLVSGHNVPFPLVARKEDQEELQSSLSYASGQQSLPVYLRTKRPAAAIEEGARQSKPKKMKESRLRELASGVDILNSVEAALAEAKRANRSEEYLTIIHHDTLSEQRNKENILLAQSVPAPAVPAKSVTFEDFAYLFAVQYRKQKLLEESVKPKGPVSRSEWVKSLVNNQRIKVNRDLIINLPRAPQQGLTLPAREHYDIVGLSEEPRDKSIKGTRELFGDIVKTWRIPDRTQDISSNHVATLGTHTPDHLMRKLGRAREQSIVVVNAIRGMLEGPNPHGDFSDEQCGQELDFLQAALILQPWRKFIYGCLTDTRRFEFYRAARDSEGVIIFERSGLVVDQEGWVALQTLLCQDDEVLGFEDVSSPGWEVHDWLGSGATSVVFTATAHGSNLICVCKMYLSSSEGELQRQRELQALQVMNDQSFVPTVVIGAPSMTRSNRYALFTTPVGLLIPDQMRLPVSAYAPLVTVLKIAHSRNLYHNDIAPSSLFAVSSQLEVKVILNDWGSAASREELDVASSMHTRKLFYNIRARNPFGAAADLAALVRSIFYLTQVTFVLDSASDCVELDAIMRQQLPVWRSALDLSANSNYDGLQSLLMA